MSRDVSVRGAKGDGPITSAFVSADDLAHNECLLEKLDGYNFNDLVEFRANPNREWKATDERLEKALTQCHERFRTLNLENHRLREQVEEIERIEGSEKVSGSNLEQGDRVQKLEMEVAELREKIRAIKALIN
ncbi:unnamed protein product [Brachionus calyciflorus]|uniref:Uncharacterized protein n=1 Tax=Brachionus calyciflorus TaxID=104777 RepID=A0A814NRB7_9BILA|nr:unnamed protein product [Brachionus calyciflorus]